MHQKNYNYTYAASCPEGQITRSTQMLLAEMEKGLTGQRDAEIQLLEMVDGYATNSCSPSKTCRVGTMWPGLYQELQPKIYHL